MKTIQEGVIVKHYQGRKQDKGFYILELMVSCSDNIESIFNIDNIDELYGLLKSNFNYDKFRLYTTLYPSLKKGDMVCQLEDKEISEDEFFRTCGYRNCNNDITEMRKDAKFCSRNCKTCEQTYRKRKAILIEKYKQNDLEKVKQYKELENLIKGGQN